MNGALGPEVKDRPRMAVFHDELADSFYVVIFTVKCWPTEQTRNGPYEPLVLIQGITQVGYVYGEPLFVHRIKADVDEPLKVRYRLNFDVMNVSIEAALDVRRLLERFPRQVERIIEMTGFVGEVIASKPDAVR